MGVQDLPLDRMYICAYNISMKVEWDILKADSNLKKHNVDFADAVSVLYDYLAVTIRESDAEEERFITLGMDALGRILVVVYTWRRCRIRIISARKATASERRRYES
jgi:uncharacterized protein